jgi:hypothetical protein
MIIVIFAFIVLAMIGSSSFLLSIVGWSLLALGCLYPVLFYLSSLGGDVIDLIDYIRRK